MPYRDEKTFTGLITELTRETTTLFRQEVQLAKAELSQKVTQAGSGATELAVGALIAFIGVQALVAAAIIGLATAMQWWLAALIVGIVIAGIGAIVVMRGIANLKARNLTPQRTINTLKDNRTWAKEHLR
jgi:predicted phage tail protein